jgi:hypothetical protein
MTKTIGIIVVGILSVAYLGTVLSSAEWSEWEDDEERHERNYESDDNDEGAFRSGWFESRADVTPAVNADYQRECGACHFAYQPGLLPKHDWQRIMDALGEHYGDDASLDEVQAAEIRRFLLDNAAEHERASRARAFAAGSDSGEALPRITTTVYFRREHAELPTRIVAANAEVGSFSNCPACHRNADDGIYNEHQVIIPGIGRWDD